MAVRQETFTLPQTATELDIEPWRMSRLGRYLRIEMDDRCVPSAEIERARNEENADSRYMVILRWLLGDLRARHESGE